MNLDIANDFDTAMKSNTELGSNTETESSSYFKDNHMLQVSGITIIVLLVIVLIFKFMKKES